MSRPRRSLRRRAALLLALVLGVSLPVALGWFPQGFLRARVEQSLQAALGPEARIARLHLVPALLSVEFEGLHLAGPGWVLDVPRGRAALAPDALMGAAPTLRELVLDSPLLSLTPAPEAPPAAPPAAAPATAPLLPVLIRGLRLSQGRVRWSSPGWELEASQIAVTGSIGEGELALSGARLTLAGEPPLAARLDARLSLSTRLELELRELNARSDGGTELSLSGSAGVVTAPRASLSGELGLELSELAGRVALPDTRGRVLLKARLEPQGGDDYRLDLNLGGSALELSGWPLERLSARLAGTRANSELSLDVDSLGGKLALRGRIADDRVEGRLNLRGLDTQRVAEARGTGPLPPGLVEGVLRFSGPLQGALDVSGQVGFASREAPALLSVEADLRGSANPVAGQLDLNWNATAAAAPPVPGLALGPLTALELAVSGRARGALPPDVDARLAAEARIATGHAELPLSVEGTLRQRAGHADAQLQLELAGAPLSLDAELSHAGPLLRLAGSELRLGPLDPRLGGRASLELESRGPLERLQAEGRVQLDALTWQDLELGDALVEMSAAGSEAALRARLPRFGLALDARLPLPGLDPVELAWTLEETPLELLGRALGASVALKGALSGEGRARVSGDDPWGAEVELRLDRGSAGSGEFDARLEAPLRLAWRERRLAVSGLDVSSAGSRLTGSFELGLEPADSLSGALELSSDLAALPQPAGWSLAGRVDAEARFAGTQERPRAEGAARLEGVSVEGPGLPRLSIAQGRVELRGDSVALPGLEADLAGGSLRLEGRLPLAALLPGWREGDAAAGTEEADLSLSWRQLDVAALLAAARGSAVEGLQLASSGKARLAGGLARLEEARVELATEAATLDLDGVLLEIAPLSLSLAQGRMRLEPLVLSARGGRFELSGELDLETRELDFDAAGQLPLRTLNPFLEDVAVTGEGQVRISARGSLDEPQLTGRVAISDGTLRTRVLAQSLTAIQAAVVFEGDVLRISDGSARLGGGDVTLAGEAKLAGLALGETRLTLTGRDIALRYPEGMNSRLDADLSLEGGGADYVLRGSVTATRGLYDLDVALGSSVLALPPEAEPSALLQAIALQIDVIADRPVLVRNNLARLEARGRLTARGDMDSPQPYGRLDILPGGKVFLRNKEFAIDSGSLVYNGDWNPSVSLVARTEITDAASGSQRYDVTLRASGPMEQIQLSFSSDPSESEAAVLSLIATGTTQGRALSSGASVAGEQIASLLTSRLTGEISRNLEQLGFDEVSIQPQLLAREQDPTARFTFGKRLAPGLKLIYSIGLGGAEERFLRVELEPWRNVTAAVQRSDVGLISYSLGQRIRFGDTRVRREGRDERERTRLEAVEFEGDLGLPEQQLRDALRNGAGRRVTEWELQEEAERVRRRLVEAGYLEAQAAARLEERTARFAVRAGPRYSWSVTGMSSPPDLVRTIREAFHEEEALELGGRRLLEVLRGRGHLRAAVEARAEAVDGERRLLFAVEPGPILALDGVSFPGAEGLSHGRLLEAAGGVAGLLLEAQAAREGIEAAYRQAHFLQARAGEVAVSEGAGRLSISLSIDEGPRARLTAVKVVGAPEADPPPPLEAGKGEPFSESVTSSAEQRLRVHYLGRGYPAVRVRTRLQPAGSDIEAVFEVSAGEAVRIGEIAVTGLGRTRESLVRSRLRFAPGDPLDPRNLVAAESRLLALGLFDRVAVFADGNPAVVTVQLTERPPFTAGYDIRYSEEESFSGLLEGEVANLAGSGLSVGLRGRAGRDVRELRGSLFRPALVLGGDITVSLFQREEDLDSGVEGAPDNLRRERGVELQQNLLLPDRWNLLYGYRFRRSTLIFADTGQSFPQNVAGLELGAFRDTRDNVLDPRRGRFLSLNLTLAPSQLGSTLPFLKGFAQASFVRRLGGSLYWAHGYRMGLGSGLGGEPMPSFERFRAGGPNSLRGFGTNQVGPLDFLGAPAGGEAVVIVNQELRWRHPATGLGAVIFYDTGEVFETASELDLDWRHVLGVGLRYESPIGLLRVDWGFPFDPREGESRNRFFFSLGQAF